MTRIVSSHNCYVLKDNQVLMLHRSEHIPRFPGFWMGPGGRHEAYEDVLESCESHVKAETGVDIKNIRLRIIATHHYPHKNEFYIVFIFLADYARGDLIEYARGTVYWVNRDKLLDLDKLYPDLRIHLPIALADDGVIYYTHIEFDARSRLVSRYVRTANMVIDLSDGDSS